MRLYPACAAMWIGEDSCAEARAALIKYIPANDLGIVERLGGKTNRLDLWIINWNELSQWYVKQQAA